MGASVRAETFWVADVIFDSKTAGLESTYTYRIDAPLRPGTACLAPLGNRAALGYVLHSHETDGSDLGYEIEKLRPILSIADEVSIPEPALDLVHFTAFEYCCPLSVALSPALPPGVMTRLQTTWRATGQSFESADLSLLQSEILAMVLAKGGTYTPPLSKKLDGATKRAIGLLEAKRLLVKSVGIAPAAAAKPNLRYHLTTEGSAIDEFLAHQAKKKPAQALALLRLQEIEDASLTTGDIKGLCGVTDATVRALIDAKLLQADSDRPAAKSAAPQLNRDQQIAVDALIESVIQREPTPFLLFGVTGSGKTEVYLRAAAEAIKMGRQVLYLVPEIALATQAIRQLRERFGAGVTILHSELPQGERYENWLAIRDGNAPIVLGARSALFAPLGNLGLIIIDEEHESSYKQESAPRYHTKVLARFLSERHGCPLVLGSATPSIESFYDSEREILTQLSLPRRAAKALLPTCHIVDLGEAYREGKPALFSDLLVEKMEAALSRKEQIILFLNRRAYATFLLCRDCGERFACPNCTVSLSFSRKSGLLRCHHCGYSRRPPDTCPGCGGTRMKPLGIGTEKIEEAVSERFPEAKVARLDRDVAQKRGALEQVLGNFGAGEVDILVGTQMVAKGLNFPGVTVVGIIAADMSLNMPDFRASERTFQLLNQVAGRAGRGQKAGEVVLQTFSPEHFAIRSAAENTYHTFYDELLAERQETNYPPYSRLINLLFSGANESKVVEAAKLAFGKMDCLRDKGVTLLGPVDCAIDRINGMWRWHILLKVPLGIAISEVRESMAGLEQDGVSVVVDIDPYSLL